MIQILTIVMLCLCILMILVVIKESKKHKESLQSRDNEAEEYMASRTLKRREEPIIERTEEEEKQFLINFNQAYYKALDEDPELTPKQREYYKWLDENDT